MFRSSKVDSTELDETAFEAGLARPITAQPESSKLAPIPSTSAELSYFTELDCLHILQQVVPPVNYSEFDTQNKFQVFNSTGQQCLFVYEESNLCMRTWCTNSRGFCMHVLDQENNAIIRMEREFACCSGCCCFAGIGSCAYQLKVESPVGRFIGTIRQACYCLIPQLEIETAAHEVIYTIEGPLCVCSGAFCPHDMHFLVMTADGSQLVGCIRRQYGSSFWATPTRPDKFRVDFDKTLDPTAKALVFSATFLIDMMFFDMDEFPRD